MSVAGSRSTSHQLEERVDPLWVDAILVAIAIFTVDKGVGAIFSASRLRLTTPILVALESAASVMVAAVVAWSLFRRRNGNGRPTADSSTEGGQPNNHRLTAQNGREIDDRARFVELLGYDQEESTPREVTELLTALDEHSLLSIADPTGRMIYVNSGFCRIAGYDREELVGENHRMLGSGTHPRAFWLDVWRTITTGNHWRGEVCNRRKDGSLYWVDTTIVPTLGKDGEVVRHASIHFDITAQKDAEAKLHRVTDLLEEAQSVARMGSWSFDTSTGAIAWSRQIYALVGRDETEGPPDFAGMLKDYSDADAVRLHEAVRLTTESGIPYSLVLRTRLGHGGVRFVRGEGRARRDALSKICGMFGTVSDVTAEVEREEALQQARGETEAGNVRLMETNRVLEAATARANRMAIEAAAASQSKSEFLANMSHEIRTPLTAILGYTDLLREYESETSSSPARSSAIDTIQRAGAHLLTIINDILDVSKIEAGKMVIEEAEITLPLLLLDVDQLMQSRVATKGVRLATSLSTPIPEQIHGDATRLRQILMNLVGNAAKFTESGGIEVRAGVVQRDGQATLRIEVEDTGLGMSPNEARLLFHPFTQADATVTRRFGGTGLGLTICRRLANMMHGDVYLDRTAPGEGSCFALELPLLPIAGASLVYALDTYRAGAVGLTATSASTTLPTLTGRILLAEDGADNQRLIAFHLGKAGAQVTVADNGRIALQLLQEATRLGQPFDLLVTDMQMPEMDGYTLARTLRASKATIAIVALTAHAMAEDRQRCLDAGCDDYAAKPIDRVHLIRTCARWMGEVVGTAAGAEDVTDTNDALQPAQNDDDLLYSDLADDPDMAELVEQFLVHLADRVADIEASRDAGDVAALASLAHQLKGAAGGYGFATITEAARNLELLAKGGSVMGYESAVAQLVACCRAAIRGGRTPAGCTASVERTP